MRPDKKLKKGEAGEQFVLIALLAIVLVSSVSIYNLFFKKLSGRTPKDICAASVQVHSSMHIGDIYIESPLECPTQEIEIKDKNKERVMQKLALAMYDCWDEFGEGRLNLFLQKEGDTTNYCVVCHHITFDEKMQIPLTEFRTYLHTHTIPGGGKSFEEYIAGYKTSDSINPGFTAGNADYASYTLDTSLPYATMFTYNKEGYWTRVSAGLIGTGVGIVGGIVAAPFTGGASLLVVASLASAGGAAGGVIGYSVGSDKASDWASEVRLIPYEVSKLEELNCTYLPVKT